MSRALPNLLRITGLELLWSFRVPEVLVYNFLLPSILLLLLGFIRGGDPEYMGFLVTGLLTLFLSSSAMQAAGSTLGTMRLGGTLRSLRVSPIPVSLYLTGVALSRIVRILAVAAMLLLVAYLVFDFRVRGNLLVLFLYALLGAVTFAALGGLLACLVRTPQSISSTINLIFLPMLFTSGVFYQSELPWVNTVSLAFPLTFLVQLIRPEALGWGEAPSVLWNLTILLLWTVVCGVGAAYLLRRRS
ncbi:MAG: ABC transporter permease [Acidobacteriota bacterium]